MLEIKKIAGGRNVTSELSIATRYYSEHIEPFQDLIYKQIKLIDPTVIICCSREFYTGKLLKEIERKINDKLWIYGYHPTSRTNFYENFYYNPVNEYKQLLKNVK